MKQPIIIALCLAASATVSSATPILGVTMEEATRVYTIIQELQVTVEAQEDVIKELTQRVNKLQASKNCS